MPLFPAYAAKDVENFTDLDPTESQDMVWEATESREAQLLASDTEEEAPPRPPAPPPSSDDFYMDYKLDRGNLRVSTLYYPGRPQYNRGDKLLSGRGGQGKHAQRERRRYWAKRAPDTGDAADAAAAAERAAAYRRLLLERPHDVDLWEKFIDFQEICAGAEAALQAAEEASARAPRSGRLRARLLAAARAAEPRERRLQRLRALLAAEKNPCRRVELWEQLIAEAGAAGVPSARATAAAALHDTRALPRAYPRLLHAYGVFLRLGGLWEELVLLVELLAAMTFPPAAFPPAPPSPDCAEQRLAELEDQILASGLPLSTMWVRVERARAAAHWRPAAGAGQADPQRAPRPHELADLLQPLPDRARLQLCATLLRLAKVPAMPGSAVALAWGEPAADCAESLLPLLRAARRLPPAHPARPSPAAARLLLALLLDPPHYFSDDTGYLSWVRALWDACCGWAGGEALLCWRLRWLHALALLADPLQEDGAREIQRIRDEAREALKRFGGGSPLAFAQFARIESVAGGAGGEGGAARAGRVALRALRAARLAPDTPVHHTLHVARIVCEETAPSGGGALSAAGAWALLSAVCGRDLPTDLDLPPRDLPPRDLPPRAAPPPAAALRAALQLCEERCAELERQFAAEAEAAGAAGAAEGEGEGEAGEEGAEGAEGAEGEGALVAGAGEWAAARALLAAPARRAALLRELLARAQSGQTRACGAAGARYWEQAACALAAAAAGAAGAAGAASGPAAALALARHFPHNAYLALASAGAPLWAAGALPHEERLLALRPRSAAAALAAPLPALLRALTAAWPPQDAEACARALRRAERRAGDAGLAGGVRALLGAARLEAEGRAPRPRLPHALYAALDAAPAAKWLHVRGAAWCAGEAGALADLLLHRQLRTHALLDELAV